MSGADSTIGKESERYPKTFSIGRAFYDVGAGRYAVDESSYLILNHGQPYSISVEAQPK